MVAASRQVAVWRRRQVRAGNLRGHPPWCSARAHSMKSRHHHAAKTEKGPKWGSPQTGPFITNECNIKGNGEPAPHGAPLVVMPVNVALFTKNQWMSDTDNILASCAKRVAGADAVGQSQNELPHVGAVGGGKRSRRWHRGATPLGPAAVENRAVRRAQWRTEALSRWKNPRHRQRRRP